MDIYSSLFLPRFAQMPTHPTSTMSSTLCAHLLLNILHALPLPLQILLPQTDLVITPRHGEDIAAQAPANAPQDGIELEHGRFPDVGLGGRRDPDPDRLVLRGGGDVGFAE